MTTRRRLVSLVLAAVTVAVPARGQAASPQPASPRQNVAGPSGMGLDEAIAAALDREPSVRGARTEIDVAEGLRRQARLRPNPTLTFERRAEPDGTDSQGSVGLEWPLDLFRRHGRVRTATHELQATRFTVSDRERLLIADVRTQYGAAAAAMRDVTVADDLTAAARRQWEVLRARVDAGGTPPLERDLLEVELRRFEAEGLLAAGRAEVAMVRLKQLLGLSPEAPLRLRDSLETLVAASPAPAAASSESSAARPDVRAAEARVMLADARVDQARREGRIDLSLFGSYMRMDAGFPQQGFGPTGALERVRGRFTNVTGGARLTVPLFNRNQGRVAAAQAEQAGAEARRNAADLAARAEVAAARAQDAQARSAVALYSGGVRTLARQNLAVVQQTFDLGRATVFDVLTEQRRYLEIEQAFSTALREAWVARTALKAALGQKE